jgi:putative hydrolases of HD superfamily
MQDTEAEATARLVFEAGVLKSVPRTGWLFCGVKNPESVAEHSFRTAFIAMLLAGLEGADPARAAYLAVVHDTQETRIGDIPHIGRRYLTAASNEAITADQIKGLPAVLVKQLTELVADYENGDSLEVLVAHDADKLECLFQAIEYRDSGHQNVQDWITNSRSKLKTASAEQLADAAITMSSQSWLQDANRNGQP